MEDQPLTKQILQKMMHDYHEINKSKVINEYCRFIRYTVLKAAGEGKAMVYVHLSDEILKYIIELEQKLKLMFPDSCFEYQELKKELLISWAEEP